MNVRTLKLAGAAAGVLFLVGTAPNVYALTTDVLTLGTQTDRIVDQSVTTTFRFNQSMILNSIGFVTTNAKSVSYTIRGGSSVSVNMNDLSPIDNGLQWLLFANPETLNLNEVVTVTTEGNPGTSFPPEAYRTHISGFTNIDSRVTVSTNQTVFAPESGHVILANGNLRVSNPSANVAPEPGSIALLLTGGGALAGIALRRRRNAG
jgi:hypothetical protein